jgi:hypothetical protein
MKGDKLSCENCRGITLLCAAYKVPTNIIRLKLEPYTENIIGECQAGFRTGRSTIDQLFTGKHTLEKCWENNIKVYQIPYILKSNPHPFYSFRGLKNQMRIRFVVESWILEK